MGQPIALPDHAVLGRRGAPCGIVPGVPLNERLQLPGAPSKEYVCLVRATGLVARS